MSDVPGTIWWDFDGTLVSRPAMWTEAGWRILRKVHPTHPISKSAFADHFRVGMPWHKSDHAHPELKTDQLWWDSVLARYAQVFELLGASVAAGHKPLEIIRSDILDSRQYVLFDDVIPVLKQLSTRGWRQIIVSNHVPELEHIVNGLGIASFFQAVITSGRVGYEKPHRRMFEAASEYVVRDKPVWMIGDNKDSDCLPVRAFGAKGILVRTRDSFHKPSARDLRAAAAFIESTERVEPTAAPAVEVRAESCLDNDAIKSVILSAFQGDVEVRLVDLLRLRGKDAISLVAFAEERVVGYALFSPITIENAPEGFRGLGLAPVAVRPEFQNRGIGSKLVRAGLERCREGGYDAAVVLGHPNYYQRFGFLSASYYGLENEYRATDAFMVLGLKEGILDTVSGLVRYAPEFQEVGC